MAKIMRTIADIKSDIRRETTSTKPLLTDDYNYGNLDDVREKISEKTSPGILPEDPASSLEDENELI